MNPSIKHWLDPEQSRDDLEREIVAKLQENATHLGTRHGLFEIWRRGYDYFHRALDSSDTNAFAVGRRGDSGQALAFSVGNSRSLASAVAGLVNNAPTSLSAGVSTTEPEAQSAAQIATAVLEHEWSLAGLEQRANATVENAIWAGEYYLHLSWDVSAGPGVARTPDGQLLRAGGLAYDSVPPWRVLRDLDAPSYDASPWVAVSVPRIRHDLAKLYPEHADKILSQTTDWDSLWHLGQASTTGSDWVLATFVYHKPSPSVPEGLAAVLVGDTLVATDAYPSHCPLVRMSAGETVGSPFGYSSWHETLAAQDVVDDAWSGLATSLRVLGKPMISAETGSDIDADRLGDEGPLLLWRSPGSQPPVPLQFSAPPPGADKLIQGLVQSQRQAVGMNDTAMGNPGTAQMNAQAFALLISAATVQSSALQQRRVKFLRDLGQAVIALYAANAAAPMTISLVGQSQKGNLERALTFTGAELRGVDLVNVDVASGLAATAPGRIQLLQLLREMGVQISAEDVVSVLDTGRMTQALSRERSTNQLVAWAEREFRAGRPVAPLFSDPPKMAELCFSLMDDPSIRANPQALAVIGDYLEGLVQLYQTTDPRVLALVGVQLPAPPPGAGAPAPQMPPEFGQPPDVALPEQTPPAFANSPLANTEQ